jgi:hypothetical protein
MLIYFVTEDIASIFFGERYDLFLFFDSIYNSARIIGSIEDDCLGTPAYLGTQIVKIERKSVSIPPASAICSG